MKPSARTPLARSERRILLTLAGMQFTQHLDFATTLALGPRLVRMLHLDTRQFGVLLSVYTFTATAAGLVSTTYVDRFDRRRLILATYGLFILATLCCGLAPGFPSLLISRAVAGAFGGVLGSMVYTMMADVVPPERRAAASGIITSALSVSSVAGVPLGLFLANSLPELGWRAPFFFIVVLGLAIASVGYKVLPSLTEHLGLARKGSVLARILAVARPASHLRAFVFAALLPLGGFTVVSYTVLYLTANVGVSDSFIGVVYMCGGAATLFSSRLFGAVADRYGARRIFRLISLASFVPLIITTHMVPMASYMVLIAQMLFMVLVHGRFVPGMAMITAVAVPAVRGTFMSLVSAVQLLAMSLASLIAGAIISRNASGQIEHFGRVGYFAVACSLMAIWVAPRPQVEPRHRDDQRGDAPVS